ncbi:MAG: hypothetical protein U0931_19880 [Vulcanimicrobiota bacterium]
MADANWSNQLHSALEEWSAGRLDRAGRGLHSVLESCQSDEMAVWRAFLHNQLALLCQDTGEWEEARHHWEAAQQSWRAAGLHPGSAGLAATLDWYADILEHYQFGERARVVRMQHQSGRPPLIDPWQNPTGGPQAGAAPAVPRRGAAEVDYAPLGGNSVSTRREAAAEGSWDQLLSQALQLAARANFARAQNLFDQARHLVVDRRVSHPHLLALVYSAESIGAFVSGSYPLAEKSRDQARELWRVPDQREDLQLFAQALRSGGQESAAVLFMTRVGKSQMPLLDPWTDLQTGLAQGQWQAPEKVDFAERLEDALKQYARGNLYECQRRLDNLALQLEADPAREALLGNLQALLAHAQGDESNARVSYNKARTRWKGNDTLSAETALLRRYQLEKMAQALDQGYLLDPFENPLQTQLGTAPAPSRPKLAEPEPEPVEEPPARSSQILSLVLLAVLLALGLGAWRLTHAPAAPRPAGSPTARAH